MTHYVVVSGVSRHVRPETTVRKEQREGVMQKLVQTGMRHLNTTTIEKLQEAGEKVREENTEREARLAEERREKQMRDLLDAEARAAQEERERQRWARVRRQARKEARTYVPTTED
jgi:hypothetical protein